jgi:hypothetical protein
VYAERKREMVERRRMRRMWDRGNGEMEEVGRAAAGSGECFGWRKNSSPSLFYQRSPT